MGYTSTSFHEGNKHPNWKGGRKANKEGYQYLYKPKYFKSRKDKYVLEHVYLFQEHYKCCMLKWGIVHHLDENPSNNEISNLIGMVKGKHQKLHREINMTNRICLLCNSKTTHIKTRNNRPLWYHYKDGYICNLCYERDRYVKKKSSL